jgi:hypothetical protein
MVARSTPSSSAHRSSGAAIGRPRSGSCQVPTQTGYRTDVRDRIGNITDLDRTGRWGTWGTEQRPAWVNSGQSWLGKYLVESHSRACVAGPEPACLALLRQRFGVRVPGGAPQHTTRARCAGGLSLLLAEAGARVGKPGDAAVISRARPRALTAAWRPSRDWKTPGPASAAGLQGRGGCKGIASGLRF